MDPCVSQAEDGVATRNLQPFYCVRIKGHCNYQVHDVSLPTSLKISPDLSRCLRISQDLSRPIRNPQELLGSVRNPQELAENSQDLSVSLRVSQDLAGSIRNSLELYVSQELS